MSGLGPGFGQGADHVAHRLANLEAGAQETRAILRSVDDSLKALVRLEAHHEETRKALGRAFDAITDVEDAQHRMDKAQADHTRRIEDLEELAEDLREHLPRMKASATWVNKALMACAVIVGGLLGGLAMERLRGIVAPAPSQALQHPAQPPQESTGR